MTLDELEAEVLRHAESCLYYLDDSRTMMTYLITSPKLVSLIRLAHCAGQADGMRIASAKMFGPGTTEKQEASRAD